MRAKIKSIKQLLREDLVKRKVRPNGTVVYENTFNGGRIRSNEDDFGMFGDGKTYTFKEISHEHYDYDMIGKHEYSYCKEWLDVGFLSEEDFEL